MGSGSSSPRGEEYIVETSDNVVHVIGGQLATATVDRYGQGALYVRDGESFHTVLDNRPRSRALYLRDLDSNDSWLVGSGQSRCRFGQGYALIEEKLEAIELAWRISISINSSLEIWQITIKNSGSTKRRLGLYVVTDWPAPRDAAVYQGSPVPNGVCVSERRTGAEALTRFIVLDKPIDSFDTDRATFFGPVENWERPLAVETGKCARSLVVGNGPIGVLQKTVTLSAGAELTYAAYLGALATETVTKELSALITPLSRPGGQEQLHQKTEQFFADQLRENRCKTGETATDHSINTWLSYQNAIGRFWPELTATPGRITAAGLAAAGLAALPHQATEANAYAELAFRHTFKDGRLLHGWSDAGHSVTIAEPAETLALVELGVAILKETGDKSWLSKTVPYYDGGSGSVLEHLVRLLTAVYQEIQERLTNSNGRTADAGRLVTAMKEIGALHLQLGDQQFESKLRRQIEELSQLLSARFWSAPWFSRGCVNGEKLPTKKGAGAFDLASQTALIISGVANSDRAKQVLNTIKRQWQQPPVIDPPYPQTVAAEPGSLPAPGNSTNGGLDVAALAELAQAWVEIGDGDNAWQVINGVLPCASSSSDSGHLISRFWTVRGRGYQKVSVNQDFAAAIAVSRVIRERIFGLQPTLGGLKIDPCLPKHWRQAEISRHFRGADYHIRIHNPFRHSRGVDRIVVDGIRLQGNVIRPFSTGAHFVEVTLG